MSGEHYCYFMFVSAFKTLGQFNYGPSASHHLTFVLLSSSVKRSK